MKIGFIGGHSNKKVGARGTGHSEEVICRDLANRCLEYAKANYNATFLTDSVNDHSGGGEETFVINNKLDYYISLHLNSASASATGTECIVSCREKTVGIETKIVNEICNQLGLRNRGIKRRQTGGDWISGYKNVDDYYGILRQPKAKGISGAILEVCFISNADDMNKLKANMDKVARIIVDAICNGFGVDKKAGANPNPPQSSSSSTSGKIYRTVIFSGSYEGAKKKEAEAKEKGFTDAFTVEK